MRKDSAREMKAFLGAAGVFCAGVVVISFVKVIFQRSGWIIGALPMTVMAMLFMWGVKAVYRRLARVDENDAVPPDKAVPPPLAPVPVRTTQVVVSEVVDRVVEPARVAEADHAAEAARVAGRLRSGKMILRAAKVSVLLAGAVGSVFLAGWWRAKVEKDRVAAVAAEMSPAAAQVSKTQGERTAVAEREPAPAPAVKGFEKQMEDGSPSGAGRSQARTVAPSREAPAVPKRGDAAGATPESAAQERLNKF